MFNSYSLSVLCWCAQEVLTAIFKANIGHAFICNSEPKSEVIYRQVKVTGQTLIWLSEQQDGQDAEYFHDIVHVFNLHSGHLKILTLRSNK